MTTWTSQHSADLNYIHEFDDKNIKKFFFDSLLVVVQEMCTKNRLFEANSKIERKNYSTTSRGEC
jgi:hypothetical protein